jgi:uncharacterized protein (DUF433 family)
MSATIPPTAVHYAHIVKTPGTMGGEPRVDGHRIRVRDIAAMRDVHGYTPEEIASVVYPSLSLGQVYAALAYYEDHRSELDEFARCEDELVENFKASHPDVVLDLRAPR